MACINKLSGDISFNCDDKPKKGLAGQRAVIINFEDIDFGATTKNGATISNLTLKDGTTGYKLEWYKELASASGQFSPNEEDIDGFSHSFMGRMATSSLSNAEAAKELKEGRFVVVYESKYQGVNQDEAFKVLGIETGLQLSEMTTNTNENSGSILFTLSTKEGEYEEYPFNIFSEASYRTSKDTVDALFTAVV
jgi:hypothetical protein